MAETNATPTISLGSVSRIPLGQGRCYAVGSAEVAIFRQRDGRLFAIQNRCPHRQGPLSEGVIGSGQVICPLHGHKFNLKSGAGSEPAECVEVHAIMILDGEIRLGLCRPPPARAAAMGDGDRSETLSETDQTA
jgi:nitrite reductase (NADH) small subunit